MNQIRNWIIISIERKKLYELPTQHSTDRYYVQALIIGSSASPTLFAELKFVLFRSWSQLQFPQELWALHSDSHALINWARDRGEIHHWPDRLLNIIALPADVGGRTLGTKPNRATSIHRLNSTTTHLGAKQLLLWRDGTGWVFGLLVVRGNCGAGQSNGTARTEDPSRRLDRAAAVAFKTTAKRTATETADTPRQFHFAGRLILRAECINLTSCRVAGRHHHLLYIDSRIMGVGWI